MIKRYFGFFALCVSLCVWGCGSGNVGLSGKITFSDDGSPLTVGTVYLSSGAHLARGDINSDGTYQIGSLSQKDGLPPGTYRVYVSGAVKEDTAGGGGGGMRGNMGGSMGANVVPLIDPKFTNANSSGIEVEVTPSLKTFDFQVDRAR